jgi:hypothetical protein
MSVCTVFHFVDKGPAADATDAPLPLGLLFSPVMMKKRKISVAILPSSGAPVECN